MFDENSELEMLVQLLLIGESADCIDITIEENIPYSKLKGINLSSCDTENRETSAVRIDWFDIDENVSRVTMFPSIQVLIAQCNETLMGLRKLITVSDTKKRTSPQVPILDIDQAEIPY